MTLCTKSIAEKCARDAEHTGDCRCRHERAAIELGHALDNVIREIEARGPDFHMRKLARVARRSHERAVVSEQDFERSAAAEAAARARRDAQADRDRAAGFDPEARSRGKDGRMPARALLANIKAALPGLEELLAECSGAWGYEDPMYRLYYGSFKVYMLQETTEKIVAALKALAPDRELDAGFMAIIREGTGKVFELGDNQRWLATTRPMVEAFFHARFFLEMAVRCVKRLDAPPAVLPSGWAALLCLYDLR